MQYQIKLPPLQKHTFWEYTVAHILIGWEARKKIREISEFIHKYQGGKMKQGRGAGSGGERHPVSLPRGNRSEQFLENPLRNHLCVLVCCCFSCFVSQIGRCCI